MRFQQTFQSASTGLRTNKSRSALTILGIVIGITAIMVVMSVGSGAQALILNQIQGIGGETIIIEPGREPKGPSDFAEAFTDSLKDRELTAIRKLEGRGLSEVTPLVVSVGTVSYEQETKRANVRGVLPSFFRILNLTPDEGNLFTEDDVRQHEQVAIIGADIKDELFGLSDAVGKRIKIKNTSLRIIGVLAKKGQVSFINVDDMVFMPYTATQDYLTGTNYFQGIFVKASSKDDVKPMVAEIEYALRELHNITDPEKDDFHVSTQEDALETVSLITTSLTAMLVSIAAISLVVGGIGIMNIMLVSVTERTREIGLRKAVGARNRDILTQFLVESVMLTMLGGLLGIVLGASISYLAALVLSKTVASGWTFSFPLSAMLLGLGVSSFVGIVFGLYPARQASKKSPMEALRYE